MAPLRSCPSAAAAGLADAWACRGGVYELLHEPLLLRFPLVSGSGRARRFLADSGGVHRRQPAPVDAAGAGVRADGVLRMGRREYRHVPRRLAISASGE